MQSPVDRFYARIAKQPNGCWLWTRPLNHGYGRICVDYRDIRAHRFAYELLVGPIPEAMVVDHTCHNADRSCLGGESCPHRACVNPAHLEIATNAQNVLRGVGLTAQNAAKIRCPGGHPLTADNVYTTRRGHGTRRRCRTCHLAHQARYNAHKKEKSNAAA